MDLFEKGVTITHINCEYDSSSVKYTIMLEYQQLTSTYSVVFDLSELATFRAGRVGLANKVFELSADAINKWVKNIDTGKLLYKPEVIFSGTLKNVLQGVDSENEEWAKCLLDACTKFPMAFSGNYYSINKDGNITFCPDGRKQKFTENGRWALEGRNEVKPVKWANRVLQASGHAPLKTKQSDYFTAMCRSLNSINIQISDNLETVYNTWHSESGNLGQSCMKGDGEYYRFMRDVFDGYNVRVAYYIEHDLLCGRALLWDIDGTTYMDRIYSTSLKIERQFKNFAASEGWWCRHVQSNNHGKTWVSPDGKVEERSLILDVSSDMIGEEIRMPYLDTFRFFSFNAEKKTYEASNDELYGTPVLRAHNTDGTLSKASGGDILGFERID